MHIHAAAFAALALAGTASAQTMSVGDRNDIAQRVNATLQVAMIEPVSSPRFDGPEPVAIFKWSLPDPYKQTIFAPARYTVTLNQPLDLTFGTLLCDAAREVMVEQKRQLPDWLRDEGPEVSAELGREIAPGLTAKVRVSSPIEWIGQIAVDLLVAATDTYVIAAGKSPFPLEMHVFSRGFASSSTFEPTPLEAAPYDFAAFPMHFVIGPRQSNVKFDPMPAPVDIGPDYDNAELPHLRGRYFEYEFVEPLREDCLTFITASGVLEGDVTDMPDQRGADPARRVEVFLVLVPRSG